MSEGAPIFKSPEERAAFEESLLQAAEKEIVDRIAKGEDAANVRKEVTEQLEKDFPELMLPPAPEQPPAEPAESVDHLFQTADLLNLDELPPVGATAFAFNGHHYKTIIEKDAFGAIKRPVMIEFDPAHPDVSLGKAPFQSAEEFRKKILKAHAIAVKNNVDSVQNENAEILRKKGRKNVRPGLSSNVKRGLIQYAQSIPAPAPAATATP